MAALITYPRELPDYCRLAGNGFWLEPMHELTPIRGGYPLSGDIGRELWRAKYKAEILGNNTYREIRAWLDTLGSKKAFWAYDKLLPYPWAYRATGFAGLTIAGVGTAFTGSANMTSVDADRLRVNLGGLPAGFVISVGDVFHYGYDTSRRAYHEFVGAAVANGSGVVTQIEVRPYVSQVVTSASIQFFQPRAKMMIVPGSVSIAPQGNVFGVEFEGVQTLAQ